MVAVGAIAWVAVGSGGVANPGGSSIGVMASVAISVGCSINAGVAVGSGVAVGESSVGALVGSHGVGVKNPPCSAVAMGVNHSAVKAGVGVASVASGVLVTSAVGVLSSGVPSFWSGLPVALGDGAGVAVLSAAA